MPEKPIDWRGSPLYDLKNDHIFPLDARRQAGHQLSLVQAGLEPDRWKPFDEVGAGTREIIINFDDGWFRIMYVAKFPEAIYVLHCFKKQSNTTSRQDKEIAIVRYRAVCKERGKK